MDAKVKFETLPVWRQAVELYGAVDRLLAECSSCITRSFAIHLERSTRMISSKIAKGVQRDSDQALLVFIRLARGFSGEVHSLLILLENKSGLAAHKSEILQMKFLADACSIQLQEWAKEIEEHETFAPRKPARHNNSRQETCHRGMTFQQRILAHFPAGHPFRRDPS